jgi:hypothetical protein
MGVALGDGVQHRGELLAGAAPGGGEKEKEGRSRIGYEIFEVCIGDFSNHGGLPCQWFPVGVGV